MATAPAPDTKTLVEVEQIKQLKARYFRLMDTKQWKEWRGCFTDDFTFILEPGAQVVGATGDEFVSRVSKTLADARTAHHGHMPEIEVTGPSTARGIWAMFDWVDRPDSRMQGFGHYHEEYEKGRDGRWRIKRSHLTRLRVDTTTTQAKAG